MSTPRTGLAIPRAAEIRAGDHDGQLEHVLNTVSDRIDSIKDTCKLEGRKPLASEQRELDLLRDSARAIKSRCEIQARQIERDRQRHEDRETLSAELRMASPIFGSGNSRRPSRTVGENLADAIDDVRSGHVASATVDLEIRNDITEGGDWGQGVPTEIGEVQRTLRARSVVMRLPGIRSTTMSSDRKRFPRLDESTANATAETEQLAESTPDLDAVTLNAQKFTVYHEMSSELEQDFEADALDALSSNMLNALALKVDHAMLEGDGSEGIVGIRNWVGINTTSVAAVPDNFDEFSEVEYELAAADADLDSAAWLMHPRSWLTLSQIKTGLSSDETTLLQPNPQAGAKTLLGYDVLKSTQITLTEGAGAGSWVGLVDGSQLVYGTRLPARVEVSRDFKFDQDIVALRAKTRIGFAVINAGAVSIATDVRAA